MDHKSKNNFKHSLSGALFKVTKGHTVKQLYITGRAETFDANAESMNETIERVHYLMIVIHRFKSFSFHFFQLR